MNIKEMIRKSIEDSEQWRRDRSQPGTKSRRATRPAVRGGSPERPNQAEEQLTGLPEVPSRGRSGAMVRVIGFIPLQGAVTADLQRATKPPSDRRTRFPSGCTGAEPLDELATSINPQGKGNNP